MNRAEIRKGCRKRNGTALKVHNIQTLTIYSNDVKKLCMDTKKYSYINWKVIS